MYFTFVYARFQVHVRNMHPYMHACGGPRLILGIIPHHSSLSTEAGSLTQTQGLPTCSVLPSKRWPPLPPAIYVGSGVLNSGRHVSVASTLTTEPPPPNGGGEVPAPRASFFLPAFWRHSQLYSQHDVFLYPNKLERFECGV